MMNSSSAPLLDPASESTAQDAELARVLEACLADIEAGKPVDPGRLVAEHPSIADRLQTCLITLNLVQQAAAGLAGRGENEAVVPVGRLGDFDILREIGRGGLGVVYEAKQISLGRRVAVEVLPFAATLDPRQLQRFWTEAQAAAILHHPHIVPVYSVGSERGVHYYAMQFIEGQTLAQIIADLRLQIADLNPSARGKTPPHPNNVKSTGSGCNLQSEIGQPTVVALSTERSARSPAYFRAVARLGVQAALALDHAHQLGVIHRDIKPANLLVDAASNLWITDFGLARLRSHAGLTLTGDTVGTLRYMSPEQALARRALVDHRTDVYSLGSTLYEALTLQPAYPGDDRDEVLRRISLGEPPLPRRINSQVPYELETIVLKAMAREPERRYATAQELADDLNRFLDHRPVQAVRPTLGERLSKWSWRHKSVLLAVAAVAGLAAVGLLVLAICLWREQAQSRTALELAQKREKEAQVNRERAEANFRKALEGLWRLLWELEVPRWNRIPGFMAARRELTRQGLQFISEFVNEGSTDPSVRFQAARSYELMVNIYLIERETEEADQAHRKAVALLDGLYAEHPENPEYSLVPGRVHWQMGNWNVSLKRRPEAKEEFLLALAAYKRALAYDRDGRIHNNLAYLLCDCLTTELRDPIQALSLAMRALALAPGQRDFWSTLALAHYRAGEWRAARAALDRAMELSAGGNGQDWLIRAMTSWRQDDWQEAHQWYKKASDWMDKNPLTDELFHLRKEAADLMGIRWPP
jgi:serine/threonine protein kinase